MIHEKQKIKMAKQAEMEQKVLNSTKQGQSKSKLNPTSDEIPPNPEKKKSKKSKKSIDHTVVETTDVDG